MGVSTGSAIAQDRPDVPTFTQLEALHIADPSDALAHHALKDIFPIGTSAATAIASLSDVDATCRQSRSDPSETRCIVHQMALGDRSFDDIRWLITLRSPQGRIAELSAKREVDRHWTM
jgi:hypothetical protein